MATALAAVCLLLAACSGVPGSGPAVVVSSLPAAQNPAAPNPPAQGAPPNDIVRGFIEAIGSSVPDTGATTAYTAARQYLTPEAQRTWAPDSRTAMVVLSSYRTDIAPGTDDRVTVSGSSLATLDSSRSYHQTSANFKASIALVKVAGQWRISTPPQQLLITAASFRQNYVGRTPYFLDPTDQVVVPDPRYIPAAGTGLNRAARVLNLLLAGPGPLLAGTVRNELQGAALRTNLTTTDDGVTHVDFTDINASLGETDRRALAAQVVWSLSADVSQIALTINGELVEPNQPSYTVTAMGTFDPDRIPGTGTVSGSLYYINSLTKPLIMGLDDNKQVWEFVGAPAEGATAAAMSAATNKLAVVHPESDRREVLYLGNVSGIPEPQSVLVAQALTTPSFTRSGNDVWVVQTTGKTQEIYQVSASANTTGEKAVRSRVAAPELANKGTVTALALSPDGVRVAIVANQKLYIGAIRPSDPTEPPSTTTPDEPKNSISIVHLTELSSDLTQVGAIAFRSSTELLVAAKTVTYRTVVRIGIDGNDRSPMTDDQIFGDVNSMAVSGDDIYISVNGNLLKLSGTLDDGKWVNPTASGAVVYGTAPFFPN